MVFLLNTSCRDCQKGSSDSAIFPCVCKQVSFEEIRIGAKELGDKTKWLKEGMECNVLTWNDKVWSANKSALLVHCSSSCRRNAVRLICAFFICTCKMT